MDAYHYLIQNWGNQLEFVEEVNVLFLNNAHHVLGIFNASKGGKRQAVVDCQVIFAAALKANATGIIVSHNHPSGRLKPSQEDIQCTEKLQSGAEVLGLTMMDHLIVTRSGYFSFIDECLLSIDSPTDNSNSSLVQGEEDISD